MTETALSPQESRIAEAVEKGEVVNFQSNNEIMDGCPIQPLGTSNGEYFFTSPDGELRRLAARDFTDRQLISLFAGDTLWLKQKFPTYDKKGELRDDFSAKNATAALMRACHMRGLYNVDTPLRGHGVWRWGDRAILHAGDGVYFDRSWFSPGKMFGQAIYAARSAVDRPDFDAPLTDIETRELRQWLNAWAFRDKGDADLLFGYLGAALIGGFPSWRVHALVIGERGIGKSELGEFLMECMGPQATSMNNYTEAGLRQKLQNEARAIWLDEGETGHEHHSRRMGEVIRLLRLLSGGQGARIVRGSSGGAAQSATVTGCVMITAINPPHLEPQDRSRIIEINLEKPQARETTEQDLSYYRSEARKRSPRLRARAFLRCDHFREAFSLFRRVLVTHGCDGRQADMFATLLAGRSILLDPAVPSQETATALVGEYQARLNVIFIEDREASDGQICLNQMFDFIMDSFRSDRRVTIGQLLMGCIADNGDDMPLHTYGMRLMRVDGMPHLFVPHDHAQLRRVFAGTVWATGGWTKSMQRLPDVNPSRDPVRVAGSKRRGVLVPYALLPQPKNERADEQLD